MIILFNPQDSLYYARLYSPILKEYVTTTSPTRSRAIWRVLYTLEEKLQHKSDIINIDDIPF